MHEHKEIVVSDVPQAQWVSRSDVAKFCNKFVFIVSALSPGNAFWNAAKMWQDESSDYRKEKGFIICIITGLSSVVVVYSLLKEKEKLIYAIYQIFNTLSISLMMCGRTMTTFENNADWSTPAYISDQETATKLLLPASLITITHGYLEYLGVKKFSNPIMMATVIFAVWDAIRNMLGFDRNFTNQVAALFTSTGLPFIYLLIKQLYYGCTCKHNIANPLNTSNIEKLITSTLPYFTSYYLTFFVFQILFEKYVGDDSMQAAIKAGTAATVISGIPAMVRLLVSKTASNLWGKLASCWNGSNEAPKATIEPIELPVVKNVEQKGVVAKSEPIDPKAVPEAGAGKAPSVVASEAKSASAPQQVQVVVEAPKVQLQPEPVPLPPLRAPDPKNVEQKVAVEKNESWSWRDYVPFYSCCRRRHPVVLDGPPPPAIALTPSG